MTLQHDASRAAPEADPAAQGPRALDKGWHARHVQWQAEGRIPPGKTQLLYEDGEPVFDRRGYPRMWSPYVAVKMQPGQHSSKMIAREHTQAENAARLAAEAAKLRSMLLPSLKPLPKRLWSLHADALLLIGPAGGISIPASAVSVLQPLALGGHHVLTERDAAAVDALAPRLAVVGLRVDRRRKGVRIAKARPGG
ncbi:MULTISPECIES: hypothetical protein [unclassified Methylobacterium]|uniref:hypothetical protein n=1 Tax=unclassified Methylobacterium TaxID=2615210 RepID=UPI0036F6E891